MEASRRKPHGVKGMESVELARQAFERRFRDSHDDPAFDAVDAHLNAIIEAAWKISRGKI